MIYVDDRTGSIELLPLFTAHRSHPAVASRRLPAGDFCFTGKYGPDNLPCSVGIERKVIYGRTDAATGGQFRDVFSSIRTGRLSGEQIPKLTEQYDIVIIVVEGIFKTDPRSGSIVVWAQGGWVPALCGQQEFLSSELYRFMLTLSFQPRVSVVFLSSKYETVEYVAETLPGYFDKPWDKHHAHMGLHTPPAMATIGKASTIRRFAATLNGVGWERSAAVEAGFGPCPAALVCADPSKCVEDGHARPAKDWTKLDGFGKVLSKKAWNELHGKFEG